MASANRASDIKRQRLPYVGRPTDVHAHADRIVIRQDGRVVAEHRRTIGSGDTLYDRWRYVLELARNMTPCVFPLRTLT